jgi:hypothetical protein
MDRKEELGRGGRGSRSVRGTSTEYCSFEDGKGTKRNNICTVSLNDCFLHNVPVSLLGRFVSEKPTWRNKCCTEHRNLFPLHRRLHSRIYAP